MSVIDRERWNILEPLLDQALELTPEELGPWLDSLSERSPDLGAELSALLSGDVSADREGFLTKPLDLTLEGVEIGAYTLERPLGHGGMGSVWLAKRTDGRFEGRAAVKLLNLSLLNAVGQERFRREGSMLARLTHPGIARLLDAGVSRGGQPFLVLEYVDGSRLDTYADDRQLSRDDRIRLFVRVLDAVGHAHANLVVHRDLKPSNILVTHDGTVKLLDFGIAKLADDGNESTAVTIEGGRAFTPQFAAPEQVRGETITTATDVYALGVILYSLLSGRHPTAQGCTSSAEMVRAIFDVQPSPLWPLDLDAVVGKALRKDPRERYQNVEALADDLERFLNNEPVSVARDASFYRTRKFVRRHWLPVVAAAGMLVLLVVATVFSMGQMRDARQQRDAAITARHRADAQADFASLLMSQVGEGPITARDIVDRARRALDHQYGSDSGFISSALLQLSSRYDELGDPKTRAALLARAESIAVATHNATGLIEVRCNIGDELRTEGKYAEANALLLREDSMLLRTPDPNVESVCKLSRATLADETDHPDQSAPALHRAIAIRDSLGETRNMFYVNLLNELPYVLDRQGHVRESVAASRRLIALLDTTGRGETMTAVVARHDLAVVYTSLGETEQAEAVLRDAVRRMTRSDPGGRLPQQVLIHYAHAALNQGDADTARVYFRMLADQSSAEHNTYWEGRALFGLAQSQLLLGQVPAARESIDRLRAISGNTDLRHSDDQVVNVNTLDGLVAFAQGDTTRGNSLVNATLKQYGYFKGRRSSILHSTLMLAARAAIALGHPDSALVYARDARKTATRDSLTDIRSTRVGEARLLEARAELQKGDATSARADAGRALVALRTGGGETHPATREAEMLVGRLR